jgi:DNA-binding Lrp family transcriptional regulator
LIATDEDMTGQAFRVLMILMVNLEFDNYITIKQTVIAEKLKMYKSDVSKAIKLLVDKKIILKVKEGTMTGYKMNPNYGWKGNVENRDNVKDEFNKNNIIEFPTAPESRDVSGITADEVPY